jgi:hypothetical protein
MTTGLTAREKTEKMGNFTWFTETTPWEEVLQAAQKLNKDILVVFCASWLDNCDEIRKTVFMVDDFKQIAEQVVLVYIEQASTDGEAYCQKFAVKIFPTFKLFSKEGFMLDNGTFKRTVEGFRGWLKEVKSGNNFYELSKQLEKNPNDRALLLSIVERMGMSDKKDKLAYLKRAIQINPDYKDELNQKIYEKMAWVLVENIPRGPNREEFFKYNTQLFQGIINAYYPDKFKYYLKDNDGLVTIMNWYLQMGDREKVLAIFEDTQKRKGSSFDLIKDFDIISWASYAYFDSGKLEEVEKWAVKVKNAVKPSEELKKDIRFIYYYPGMYRRLIEFKENAGKTQEAEKYALLFYEEMKRLGFEKEKEEVVVEFASTYKSLADIVNRDKKQ